MRWLAAAGMMLAVVGCGESSSPAPSRTPATASAKGEPQTASKSKADDLEEFEGLHYMAFEGSIFYANGKCPRGNDGPSMWLEVSDHGYGERLDELYPKPRRGMVGEAYVTVRFRGKRSPPGGHYGHLGMYDQQVEMIEILDASKAEGCGDEP